MTLDTKDAPQSGNFPMRGVFLVGALGVVYGDIGAIPGWGALPRSRSRAKAVGFNGRQYLRPLGAVALSMRWLLN
jgi:K+ transporter